MEGKKMIISRVSGSAIWLGEKEKGKGKKEKRKEDSSQLRIPSMRRQQLCIRIRRCTTCFRQVQIQKFRQYLQLTTIKGDVIQKMVRVTGFETRTKNKGVGDGDPWRAIETNLDCESSSGIKLKTIFRLWA